MSAASIQAVLPGITDPFPGLRPFESDEEPIFRGRQKHTDELLRRLSEHRFLAVVGTSGSGKSSLVRAGLLPALDRGYLAGATSRWRIAVMRPGMAPIENLAAALPIADAAKLRSSSLGLVETVREAGLTAGESLLVVADQFEELFRYQRRMSEADGGGDAALFVNLLLTAVRRPDVPVYVVLTMRSDFLGDCAQFPGLPEALSESQYLIPRLTREQRRQAIEEPLRLFGASMTPQLVEQLLNDSGDEVSDPAAGARYRGGAPDPLPVLQHALMRTYFEWKALPQDKIDLLHYRNAGRMAEALDQHAERLFTKDLDDEGRRWAERIFRCLTTTELGRPVRRPTPLEDLYKIIGARDEDRAKIDEVLAIFRRRENSFLQLNKDSSVDISHESLIWKWKRLGGWVAEEASGTELYRDLVKDARGKATWGEPKLSSALAVRNKDAWNADWALQYSESRFADVEAFLARSRHAVRNQRWLRWFGMAAAVIVVILGGWAEYLRRQGAVIAQVNSSLEKDAVYRKQYQTALEGRIAGLDATQGKTKDEQERIAKEKLALEAQLKKSEEDSKTLAAQAQQSTDLLGTVKALQSRLETAQRDRDEEAKKRQTAESKTAQLESTVSSLTKDLESARAVPRVEAPKGNPPVQQPLPSTVPAVASEQPLRTLEDQGNVSSVAWSPDGTTLASANVDTTIRLWKAATGESLRILLGNQGDVTSVAWSPDGKTLASSGKDKTIVLWEAASGRPLLTLKGHQGLVESVAWSPDGKTLASAGTDQTIRLWDISHSEPLYGSLLGMGSFRTLRGHTGWVFSVAWSPDGKTLASGSEDATAGLWDATSGKMLRTLKIPGGTVFSVAWSPDGKTLASASGNRSISLWDAATRHLLRTLNGHQGGVVSVAWSPDGKRLASASYDQTIRMWEAASGKPLRTLQGNPGFVNSVAWSPDGKTLAAGGDKTIRLWAVVPESQ